MFQTKNFTFNNTSSVDMGVMMIYSQLPTKILGVQKTGKSTTTTSKKHYLGNDLNSQLQVPSFNIQFTFVTQGEDVMMPTPEQKVKVLSWLMPADGQYKAFIPEGSGLEYFVKVTAMTEQEYNNGLYITVTFQMNCPYTFIPMIVRNINLTDLENQTANISIDNLCNVEPIFKPIIKFEGSPYSKDPVSFTVTNNTTGDSFTINNIEPSEVIYINNRREFINSTLPDTFRINDMTGDFITMFQGKNNFTFTGNGKVFFMAHYPTLMF